MSNRTLQLQIDGMTSEGQGIGRLGRDVYFVPGALHGEKVTVALEGRRKKVWQTRLISVDEVSPQRTDPACPHYRRCGGCDLQHLEYPAQVEFKQQRIEREFYRQKLEVPVWKSALTDHPWHYRRKARLGIRYSKDKDEIYVGFREGRSEHLTNIDRCPVLPELDVLDWKQWRELISRLDSRSKLTQVEVVSADNGMALVLRSLSALSETDARCLIDWVAELDSESGVRMQLWVREGKEPQDRLLYPEDVEPLHHHVLDMPLQIQLSDFFQINGAVNRAMVTQALEWLKPDSDSVVWDLFAGHGNFSMPLATRTRRVIAVEGQHSMVASLKRQAESLALPLQAIRTDLSDSDALSALPDPDVVLLDPARAGAAEVVKHLITRQVKRVLYVSCDPATLARDLRTLVDGGYLIEQAGMMDMFPQTHHVETMVLLSRQEKRRG